MLVLLHIHCFNPQLVPFAPDCNERKWPLKDKSGILKCQIHNGFIIFYMLSAVHRLNFFRDYNAEKDAWVMLDS